MMQLSNGASSLFIFFFNCDTFLFLWFPHRPDVAGDLDSQTIEVLASWMLEHPLSEEQQAAESPRPEGVPDTPSPDGPETVQCPERPTSQPSERSVTLISMIRIYGCLISQTDDLVLFCDPVYCQGLTGSRGRTFLMYT